jgi:hypothetical protein
MHILQTPLAKVAGALTLIAVLASTAQFSSQDAEAQFFDPNLANSELESDRQFIACMQSAVAQHEEETVNIYRSYHDAYESFLEQRADARLDYWTIVDDRDRRDVERQVEREAREQERDLKRELNDHVRDVDRAFRDMKRDCERLRKDLRRQERDDERFSSRSSRSGSSRSSFGFSSRSSRFSAFSAFSRFSTFSRSSAIIRTGTSTGGSNCQPFRCPDGSVFPTCTAEGFPINYAVNPCVTHGL